MAPVSPLDRGRLRQKIAGGSLTAGTFVGLGPATAEISAVAGVDFIVLDTEHGTLSDDTVGPSVLAAGAYGVPTIVRIETGERIRVGRALDAGAAGIMFPRVRDGAHAEELLRTLLFPPRGERGVATYNRAARFALEPENLATIGEEILGVMQIETASALADVDAIAALDGVDVLFVGPLDLSYALGVPHDFQHPIFTAALTAVVEAAAKAKKSAGILSATPDLAPVHAEMGFTFIAIGSDSTLLAHSLRAAISPLNSQPDPA